METIEILWFIILKVQKSAPDLCSNNGETRNYDRIVVEEVSLVSLEIFFFS